MKFAEQKIGFLWCRLWDVQFGTDFRNESIADSQRPVQKEPRKVNIRQFEFICDFGVPKHLEDLAISAQL